MKRCFENMQQIYRRTPIRSAISIKLLCNFTEIALWHGCSPVNLLHVFRTPFPKNTSEWLLLQWVLRKLHSCKEVTYFLLQKEEVPHYPKSKIYNFRWKKGCVSVLFTIDNGPACITENIGYGRSGTSARTRLAFTSQL